MYILVCLSLILGVSFSGMPRQDLQPSATSPTRRVYNERMHVSHMYWAIPQPILCKDWYLVVGGTVLETHKEEGHDAHPRPYVGGTMTVERIFLNLPTRNYAVSPNLKIFMSNAFDGLKRGDKVIVFVNEYDGGYGIISVLDSNCGIGIKVKSWDEPIVGAIEAMIRGGGGGKNIDARKEMLKDANTVKVWRRYSSRGIAYLLEDKDYWP
jgi:hypothetical protein